ncbi:MAG: hypothetical protein HOP19_22790 [Acidobacteria bacterium]|nr:hypothetical protein [Acidobacteriota bacterium]
METMENASYEGVLSVVRQWPATRQIELVHEVLRAISPRISLPLKRQKTLDRALGLLANEKSAPTDAEVQQWLDDYRVEKYG